VYANWMMTQMMVRGSAGEQLHREIRHFVASFGGLADLRGWEIGQVIEEVARWEVPIGEDCYLLYGSYLGFDLFGEGDSTVVVLERLSANPQGDDSLRERFGLSAQETRIARFLAQGRSNREIAELLVLSPHTIRHHTESVLRKLGIRSRAAVASTLLR
jgi:DNA-binding CsgD family transcriptional regulator